MLTTKIALSIAAAVALSADLGAATSDLRAGKSVTLTHGTGANQATLVFGDTRTLAASANESLDLAGSLVDTFGNLITFAKIKAVIIVAAAANVNDVVVGGAAANAWFGMFGDATDKVNVKPGGCFAWVAPDVNGSAVTPATADLLKIANSGGTTGVTYDIILIGV
jgi:hypothetical protein